MKPSLLAVVISVAAAFIAGLAFLLESRAAAETESRLAALEASIATERPKPAEVLRTEAAKPVPAPPGAAAPASPATSASPAELAALQAAVTRIERRVRDLTRETHAPIDDEIAGITADVLHDKYLQACHDSNRERLVALVSAFVQRFPNDPRIPQALLHIGKLEIWEGDVVEGRRFHERLIHDFPGSAEASMAQFYLAKSFVDAGDLVAGTAHFEKAVEALKGDPYWYACALYHLADTWSKRGQPEVAKEYFRKVVAQVNPTGSLKELVDKAAQELKALEGR
ncbi:MAG: tetratricopeptide repeat protein [Planctomycetes bacterium]|nr:tetratricopeptide repeat protein [Planctomycetota bacterium]